MSQVHLPKDMSDTLGGISDTLSQFTQSLFTGTKELIEEVSRCMHGACRAAPTAWAAASPSSHTSSAPSRMHGESTAT